MFCKSKRGSAGRGFFIVVVVRLSRNHQEERYETAAYGRRCWIWIAKKNEERGAIYNRFSDPAVLDLDPEHEL